MLDRCRYWDSWDSWDSWGASGDNGRSGFNCGLFGSVLVEVKLWRTVAVGDASHILVISQKSPVLPRPVLAYPGPY